MMTMHRTFHHQPDVIRLYIFRSNGGRGIIIVKDCVEMETESLKKYVESSNERTLNGVKGEGIVGGRKTKKEIIKTSKKNFVVKLLHSQFMRKTVAVRDHKT